MSAEQVEGIIGLSVIGAGFLAMIAVIRADARAQRAHDAWMKRYHEWLFSGMKGPRP